MPLKRAIQLAADSTLTPVMQRPMPRKDATHAAEMLSERTALCRVALLSNA